MFFSATSEGAGLGFDDGRGEGLGVRIIDVTICGLPLLIDFDFVRGNLADLTEMRLFLMVPSLVIDVTFFAGGDVGLAALVDFNFCLGIRCVFAELLLLMAPYLLRPLSLAWPMMLLIVASSDGTVGNPSETRPRLHIMAKTMGRNLIILFSLCFGVRV